MRTWDAFVSHSSGEKAFARNLADGLRNAGLRVWFDESELDVGDGLRRSIDKGLAQSRYGIVILSPNLFGREWPERELDAHGALEDGKEKVILPVWSKIGNPDPGDPSQAHAGVVRRTRSRAEGDRCSDQSQVRQH